MELNTYDPQQYLLDWIASTEAIVGSIMVKKKVKFSETDEANIHISLTKKAASIYEMTVRSRVNLRFVDMGAGRGYTKGVAHPRSSRMPSLSSRKPKKILTKPLFQRLAVLQSVIKTKTLEMAELNIEKFTELINNT